VFGAGAVAALAGAGFLLPQRYAQSLGVRRNMTLWEGVASEQTLRIDDDVAEALYSVDHKVPTTLNRK